MNTKSDWLEKLNLTDPRDLLTEEELEHLSSVSYVSFVEFPRIRYKESENGFGIDPSDE